MNYVIEILTTALRNEQIARAQATNALNNHAMTEGSINAFKESWRLANERIPQLEKALEAIEKL